MIVPKGKKGLSCSLGQLKLLLPRDMIVPWGKANIPPGKAQVPRGNTYSEIISNQNHLIFVFI